MCDAGTCRPCRMEDLRMDRVMGAARGYITPTLPSLEENIQKRKVIGNSLISAKRSTITRPKLVIPKKTDISEPTQVPPKRKTTYSQAQAKWVKELSETRKKDRELVEGRLVSIDCHCHGTYSGYINWFCRCVPCTKAYSDKRAGRKPDVF